MSKRFTAQGDIQLINNACPVRVQLNFFLQKSGLTCCPAGCVLKPCAVIQWGVLSNKKMDAASIRRQTQLIKQLLKAVVGRVHFRS